ncbi:MAG TPA: stage II sporulation protein P [Desulfotomaculum sp.]|nr:MAG: Stage II sporulation protein P [Desulfotomaculum sp. 46_80]KUK85250.1 MAG: Stage II sporulation protein P [Desulfofundulus kuznetsovii]HAG11136.1 stage II sporulation protein P [Desulfotomaculum sp.]HBY03246.1 stage II sporulation protein P [Desulfotomaculum sp.]
MFFLVFARNAVIRLSVILAIFSLLFLTGNRFNSFIVNRQINPYNFFSLSDNIAEWLLWAASPLIFQKNDGNGALSWRSFEPEFLLQSEIPLLAFIKPDEIVETDSTEPAVTIPDENPLIELQPLTGRNTVFIYHTHTGETYTLTDGMDRLEGKCGGVVTAGSTVKEVLENNYGLKVIHSVKIHDRQYAVSYRESEKTVRNFLSDNPKVSVIIDIHRDAGKSRKNSLVKINGQQIAPLCFIVGSDSRQPFPNWKDNYQFASHLSKKLDEKYPGLCLGVRISKGRYNQFLHPRSILVEIGSASNSTEEAVATARLFADVLGDEISGGD